MHRITTTFFLCLFLISSGYSQRMDLFDKLLFVNNGDTLPYRLLKPVSPESKDVFPLVIFLHGAGERGNDNEVHTKHITDLFLDTKNRGKYPCYVLAPQCPKNEWWARFGGAGKNTVLSEKPTMPMQMVIELIEKIKKEYPIDETRIYVTGVSMGGYGTWDLISRYPNKFAAAVPVCGGGSPKLAPQIKHVPVWAFHGALDKTVSPQQSRHMINALQEAGGTPGYTEYPDVEHNSWVHAYREPHLIHWLFKQKLATATSSKKEN